MTGQDNIIELRGVDKSFEDTRALEGIDLSISNGEFLTLLGPSGCGKTTILRILSGFETPDQGDVSIGGQRMNDVPPERRQVNTVFQNYALFPHMTVRDNVAFGLRMQSCPKGEIEGRVLEALRMVHLEQYADRRPHQLSGGQQQRVAIARALVKMPRVLLLDEPLSNLDARLRLQTREEIRKIQKKTGITTVFVTHDQDEAMSISDRIAVMRLGVLMQMGRPQEVYDNPANLFVAKFLGTPPINVFEGRVRDGRLYIGDEAVFSAEGVPDQEVWAGVRPEGFLLQEDGPLTCELNRVEIMGRDISIISSHKACAAQAVRSIITAETSVNTAARSVRFALKPGKVFLFHKETEERIL